MSNLFIYKLTFNTPVHFGADKAGIGVEKVSLNFRADTFFSALCLEILKLFGEEELNTFKQMAEENNFLITDLMPYKGENIYLPRPFLPPTNHTKTNSENKSTELADKKKWKKLKFISLKNWDDFILGQLKPENEDNDFGKDFLVPKVAVSRHEEQDSDPYFQGGFVFNENCGLYFLVKIEEKFKEKFKQILKSLSFSGIGGERSSGFGKFDFEEGKVSFENIQLAKLQTMTQEGDFKLFMNLSSISPNESDLNLFEKPDFVARSYYQLVERRGFIYSESYRKQPKKKKNTVMFASGSCFPDKLNGCIQNVSTIEDDYKDGGHPVYRYGKAFMIGIKK